MSRTALFRPKSGTAHQTASVSDDSAAAAIRDDKVDHIDDEQSCCRHHNGLCQS